MRLMQPLHSPLLRFAVVGAAGFVVDAGVLTALSPMLGVYVARAFSFLAAASFTWWLNRHWTFAQTDTPRSPARSLLREWAHYVVLMLGGGAVNYAAFALTVMMAGQSQPWPIVGVAVGSVAGLLVNFLSARWLLKGKRQA